jgi:cyclic pyranopterin phosphate synthase
MAEPDFTHLDAAGHARMVDVGAKDATRRRAVARCSVTMSPATSEALASGALPKGDVLAAVRIAGIQAAKRTAELIPLCHPLALSSVAVEVTVGRGRVDIEAVVETTDRTGVEMEALTACSVAALTLYDMAKSADRGMVIGDLALWEKSGGSSGDFRRSDR